MKPTFRFLSKKDTVAEYLRKEIFQGHIVSGTQIQQDELARRLDVSPTPVREAFRTLQAEGLLIGRPHRGVFVAGLDPGDWEDYYEIRRLLEVEVIRRVAESPNEGLLKELERCVARGRVAMKRPDVHRFRLASAAFHDLLFEGAHSGPFAEVARSVMSRSLFFIPLNRQRMAQVLREHSKLIESLRSGGAHAAQAQMNEHLLGTVRFLRSRK